MRENAPVAFGRTEWEVRDAVSWMACVHNGPVLVVRAQRDYSGTYSGGEKRPVTRPETFHSRWSTDQRGN